MANQTEANLREPNVSQQFSLALIGKAGPTSRCAFQQRAGLQPGCVRAARHRLESRQLIKRAASSARRRRAMPLTADGIEVLRRSWGRCLDEPTDTEGVLRAACVALLIGAPKEAVGSLRKLAHLHQSMAHERSMEVEQLKKTRRDPFSTYAWIRTLTRARRRCAEGKAFSGLGHLLGVYRE